MKSLRERTEIQQAYLDGKQVQVSDDGIKWRDPINLCFDSWNCVDYRIKPKPMEIWVNIFPDGSEKYFVHESKEEAVQCVAKRARTVKFIEAIE